MNILYLCDEYPPGKHGGIGTSVRLLARAMVRLGHHVVVAGLYSPGYGGEDSFENEGVMVYRFRRVPVQKWSGDQQSVTTRIINRLAKHTGLMDRGIKRSLAAFKTQLEEIITQHRIDIVEMPDYNDYIRFCNSYIPFPELSVPVIVKLHGSLTYIKKEAGNQVLGHVFKMEQSILKQATAIASVSKYTADKSSAYFSYSGQIEILHNGIDTQVPINIKTKNQNRVVFTGSLVKQKGIYQLLKAWNKVIAVNLEAELIVLGKGPQQKAKANLDKKAVNKIKFMGHVSTEKLYDYLTGAAISVFPSYTESFSLAPLEAMVCGTAVINTNRCSGPELIEDGENGILIDPDDVDQIASAILQLLNDKKACERIAKNGMSRVKECFDIESIAVKNATFYREVLSRG